MYSVNDVIMNKQKERQQFNKPQTRDRYRQCYVMRQL